MICLLVELSHRRATTKPFSLSHIQMSDSATIIRDGDNHHRLQINHRDGMLLSGPGFVEGPAFSNAFGFFENFTVRGGIPKGSLVHREGHVLHTATSALLAAIKRDYELLRFDYSYKIDGHPKQFGGAQSISVADRHGTVSLRPKGYCAIEFLRFDGNVHATREVLDLRTQSQWETDQGVLKVYRRKAETHWLELLPPVLDFLAPRLNKVLSLEHIDRVRKIGPS